MERWLGSGFDSWRCAATPSDAWPWRYTIGKTRRCEKHAPALQSFRTEKLDIGRLLGCVVKIDSRWSKLHRRWIHSWPEINRFGIGLGACLKRAPGEGPHKVDRGPLKTNYGFTRGAHTGLTQALTGTCPKRLGFAPKVEP